LLTGQIDVENPDKLRCRYGRYFIFNKATCELDITLLVNRIVTAAH